MKRKSNGKSKIRIDKNIPLPKRNYGRPIIYGAVSDLKIGNSIAMSEFPVKSIATFRGGIYNYCMRKHPKWRMSVMRSDRAKDGGARVWRIK